MFVRNAAVTPGPSRECDITFFAKGRPKSTQQLHDSTVAARRAHVSARQCPLVPVNAH